MVRRLRHFGDPTPPELEICGVRRRGKKLEIVPGATHLFEEPGKLEEVARPAAEWFLKYLLPRSVGACN